MKNRMFFLTVSMLIVMSMAGQTTGSFKDSRDGKAYKTVKIGIQTWMSQNLNYSTGGGCWCYENKKSNCVKYGRMYDFKTAQIVCPNGWRLPSKSDFEILLETLKGSNTDLFIAMIDSTGFSAQLGGWHRESAFINDGSSGDYGSWWSSTKGDKGYSWSIHTHKSETKLQQSDDKGLGLSVRCLKK